MEPFKLMQNCVNCSSSLEILKVHREKSLRSNGHGCTSNFCRPYKYIQDFSLVGTRRVKSKKLQIICCVAYVLFQFCGLSNLGSVGTAGSIAIRLA